MSTTRTVRGLAITPLQRRSLHLTEIELPKVGPDEVQIRVVEAGVCGTDRELIEGHFGRGPEGSDELVIGHELLGVVESVGTDVSGMAPGDLVVATARRSCGCPQCEAGESDFCARLQYKERGIVGLHGYYTDRFVERAANLVTVPAALRGVGVLVEPLSVPEKNWRVVTAIQSRMRSWKPAAAAVFGAGPIGLLATLLLRSKGLDVWTLDLKPPPNANAEIVEACGGRYVPSGDLDIADFKRELPNVDVVIECTGSGAPLGDAMRLLGTNGVLVLVSGIGTREERTLPMDKLYREFVGGNKVMVGSVNSSLDDFRAAVADLGRFEKLWPGLTERLITRRLPGLEGALALPDAMRGQIKTIIDLEN